MLVSKSVKVRIKPGISTLEISELIDEKTKSSNAISAPKGYRGFPQACCTSVNHVVCHGIPSKDIILKQGDIINVDVTPIVDGYHGDTSRTFLVGESNAYTQEAEKLITCTKQCLDLGIQAVKPKCLIEDIAKPITFHAKKHNYSVVRDFVGHGIGKVFHLPPNIQHCYYTAKLNVRIKLPKNFSFTIEPMLNQGSFHVHILQDGWTAVTTDGKLSAQFEHTIGILDDGSVEIFTLP